MVRKTLKKYWLVLVLIVVVLLRLPSLFEPFTYGDEGIYLALGQAARKGLVLYRDIHDNKPPMLYLLAGLAGNFSTYRLVAFFWSLATIFLFYRLSKALFKRNLLAVIISTTVFALLSSTHTFEGNVANAENFMLLPTIAAFYLLVKKGFDKKARLFQSAKIWLLLGTLLSLATLFKFPAAFDFVALLVLLFFTLTKNNFLSVIHHTLFAILGFLLPIFLTIIYYASQGAMSQYLTAAFFQNIPYLSSWSGSQSPVGALPLPLLSRGLAVALLVLFLFLIRKRISLTSKLILVWFAFSWFAALLSSRPYPHYFIQLLPALCFSLGLFFVKQKQYLKEKIIPAILPFVFITTFIMFQFWHYKNLPYYLNFYQFILGSKDKQEYFTDFDGRANAIYQVANYLQTRNFTDEKIFIWGNLPFIYPLAQRLPVGRYTVAYHIIDFDGYQETMVELQKQKPRYIIVDPQEKRPFPEFFLWLEQKYSLAEQIGDFHRLL